MLQEVHGAVRTKTKTKRMMSSTKSSPLGPKMQWKKFQRISAFQRRQYNIQDVIKRRQILLVQVVKEERGNKGAALTTYLSLAGRYSVLMPNTARGGGISRKITSIQDRKRLKDIVKDLEVPKGMGVILRTAGANAHEAGSQARLRISDAAVGKCAQPHPRIDCTHPRL